MPYKIAVASGKGGTGKTSFSVTLHTLLKKHHSISSHLVDCDVEEPNTMLFFSDIKAHSKRSVYQNIPAIDKSKCTFCGQCADFCEFNAISVVPNRHYISVDKHLCHSCGACLEACTHEAISEIPHEIGEVRHFMDNEQTYSEGRLKIGSPMQTMLIAQLKKGVDEHSLTIYDAPPGTSCAVVETISDMDYVILVAEPTRFGLYDLKLMIELMKKVKMDYGVVINKYGIGDHRMDEYLRDQNIPVIGKIPFNKAYATQYAKGELHDAIPEEIRSSYAEIIEYLKLKGVEK